jgi:hypothetical protein
MRKVKFTQDSFDEKLGAILTEFPILDVRFTVVLFFLSFGIMLNDRSKNCTNISPALWILESSTGYIGSPPLPVLTHERPLRQEPLQACPGPTPHGASSH